MANERITEDMVRKHFNSYSSECTIEEQKSSNPKIDKLLKNASKKGSGKGHPEFIISPISNPNFIIVIECKANIIKHQSSTLDKYDEYAVDGVLLYASFLSKEYDVLAIGVSGQTLKELKVSHFLYLKGANKPIPIFGNELSDIKSYVNGYSKSDEKVRQDYNTLLDFSRELNVDLHHYKIPEKDRALLISSILISLDDEAFRKAYKYKEPVELADFLVNTVSNVLRKANLNGDKLENLNIQFSFIRTNTSLSTKPDVLRNLIDNIDENIKKFIRTYKYYDVLGQLYIEFLRYANSDTGLGIVLTPPHITELFSELAVVNKNSIVYDNCAGTGGFLISAMKKMIEDANGVSEKENQIKAKQIIGVEYQASIFALACSNMYIHQDGKTNIIKGDCFDAEVMELVKKSKPTVGFLNPPYKVSKEDTEELEFVLNNLEILQPGGACIAIVPMQCALAQKGKVYELKKQLLQKHTLEAALSMPDELFFNSDVGVVTCVMIFTAHKPHPANKETYFGYYKDDGFVKRKEKGRIDAFGKWQNIKAEWVFSYINRKEKLGFSVNKVVTAEDEWCAEAYMETDYSKLSKDDFRLSLKSFLVFKFATIDYEKLNSLHPQKIINQDLGLNTSTWQFFDLCDLFKISSSSDSLINDYTLGGRTPYISSSEMNNGMLECVKEDPTNSANTITANRGGSVGYFFYQPVDYLATPVDVRILTPKFNLNKYIGLFIVTVLRLEKFKFNFSRKMGTNRLKQLKIKLPTKNGKPDFEFMENYIKSLPYSSSI